MAEGMVRLVAIQYRYVGGSRRWKEAAVTTVERAESLRQFVQRNADAPVETRIKVEDSI